MTGTATIKKSKPRLKPGALTWSESLRLQRALRQMWRNAQRTICGHVKAEHIPSWFKLADYAEAENFNFSDWAVMISHRHLWRQSLDTTYPRGVPNEQKASFWNDYLGD